MRSSRLAAASALAGIVIPVLHRLAGAAGADLVDAVWGGKMEHCAIAIGMIAGGILGVIANPVCGPIAFGMVTAGLVWLLSCA